MSLPRDAMLLRIYLGEAERNGHKPLYEVIVLKAHEMHLAGATVLRGPLGYGHSGRLHSAKILDLSGYLPVIVEIVDVEDKLRSFLDAIESLVVSTLVTLEKVQVLQYGMTRTGKTD